MNKSKRSKSAGNKGVTYLKPRNILVVVLLFVLAVGVVFISNKNRPDDGTVSTVSVANSIISPVSPVPTEPETSTSLYEKGQEAFSVGKCAEAIVAYTRALEAGYVNPGVVYNSRGNAYT